MSKGARKHNVPLRDLLEILGGRRYGSDTRCYGPIFECYERLSVGIPEPYKTRLIVHILNETSSLRQSRTARRSLIRVINEGFKKIEDKSLKNVNNERMTNYFEFLLDTDLYGLSIGIPLYFVGYSQQAIEEISQHLTDVIQITNKDYTQRIKLLGIITEAIINQTYRTQEELEEVKDMLDKDVNPYEDAVALTLESILKSQTAGELVNILGIDEIFDDLLSKLNRSGPSENSTNPNFQPRNLWSAPREFYPRDIISLSIGDDSIFPYGIKGIEDNANLEPITISPQYLYNKNSLLKRHPEKPAYDNEALFAQNYFNGNEDMAVGLSSGEAMSIIPDQIYLIIPNNTQLGIVFRDEQGYANLIALLEDPVIINTNGLLALPEIGEKDPLDYYWLVNLDEGSARIHVGNAFDPNF